jgi:hypothetical protein
MILVAVGRRPFLVSRQVTERLLRAFRADVGLGCFEDRFSSELAVGLLDVAWLAGPGLAARIGLLEQVEDFDVPMVGITAVRLCLHIVPPHVLLAPGEGPRGLAGHSAALATDATVDVEHEGKLLPGKCRFEWIFHVAAQLPIPDVTHEL